MGMNVNYQTCLEEVLVVLDVQAVVAVRKLDLPSDIR
jgi:hypothetical protein